MNLHPLALYSIILSGFCSISALAGPVHTIDSDTTDIGPKTYSNDETFETAMKLNANAYYIGKQITFNSTSEIASGHGLHSSGGKYIDLDDCSFTVASSKAWDMAYGIRLANMLSTSRVSNSTFDITIQNDARSYGILINKSVLEIENVTVNDVGSTPYTIYGIGVADGSTLTGRGYNYNGKGMALYVTSTSTVNLSDARINSTAGHGALYLSNKTHTVMTDSTIIGGNVGVYSTSGTSTGDMSFTMNGGRLQAETALHNYSSTAGNVLHVNLNDAEMIGRSHVNGVNSQTHIIMTNSDWVVTLSSEATTLSLDAASSLTFNQKGSSVTDIYSLSVMLATNSLLQIDVDGEGVEAGDRFTLFRGLDNGFNNLGARLTTADGNWEFEYINPEDGVFEITGVVQLLPIPEPSAVTLGLCCLSALLMRRRKLS